MNQVENTLKKLHVI